VRGSRRPLTERGAIPRHPIALAIAVFATVVFSAAALAAASARPKTGHYAGKTSEHEAVTFKVTDRGRRVTGFTTVDGYNMMCHYGGTAPHIFHYTVKVASMKVEESGSFAHTVKATKGPFRGTFRVKGRFSSGKARGTVTRFRATCGSRASNPRTSDYLERFTAKRS
jgi:hypothetical protein